MEEKEKLYSQAAMYVATFFGGPLAAGILVRRNALNMGKEKQGLYILIAGIVSTILLFAGIIQIPEHIIDKIPKALIPAVYTGIIYLIVEKIHGKTLKKHKEENKPFYSNWRAAGIGLVSFLIIIVGIFAYVWFEPQDWDMHTYDSELEAFSKNEEEAIKLFSIWNNPLSSPRQVADFIEKTGIPAWQENLEILNRMDSIENIPEKLQTQNKLLREYTMLRIESYQLISKAVLEETDIYDNRILRIHKRIDMIMEE